MTSYASVVECFSNSTERAHKSITSENKSPYSTKSETRPRFESPFVLSYGVGCVRKNANTGCYEILMIKKRNTYSFVEFVRGSYDPSKDRDIHYMFEGMTITEKSMIQTRRFDTIWEYSYGYPNKSSERSIYQRSLKKYNILVERGILSSIITNTKNADLLWEIPKGRANKKETPLISATREFEEETGISKKDYRILFDEGPIEYSFVDCGVKYKYIYYIATLGSNVEPTYDYKNNHMLWELSELRFMTSVAIQEMNGQRLAKIARIMIKKAKKYL